MAWNCQSNCGCQCKCEKGWDNGAERFKTLIVNKDKNVPAFFCISLEHHSEASNRDLGFTGAR